jgi:hypothetical protein
MLEIALIEFLLVVFFIQKGHHPLVGARIAVGLRLGYLTSPDGTH